MFSVLSKFAQTMSDMDMSVSSSDTSMNSAATAAAAGGFIIIMLLVGLLIYVFFSICLMKIFKKAGRSDAWAAFIPIYNMFVYFEIAGRPGWWAFLSLIPVVGGLITLITGIIGSIDLAKSFGKEAGYGILLALVPVIGYPMLAFGNAQYQGPAGPEGHGAVNPQQPMPSQPIQQPQSFQPPQVTTEDPVNPTPPVDNEPPTQTPVQ